MYLVPAWLYRKVYGNGHEYLECPYKTGEIVNNLANYGSVYDMLTSEESKLTFLNILAYRITFNRDYASRAYSAYPQYYIPAFCNLTSEEVFVDCGAFIGDTLELYCKYNQPPREAYLFEPDSYNLKWLRRKAKQYEANTKITIIEKGVYKKTGTLYFVPGMGSDCHLTETPRKNSSTVEVVAMDDLIKGCVSFIKMDIEGAEYDAILGAERIIRTYYPKLAICLYHSLEDLWRIPLMIKEKFPDYDHYEICHHKTFFSETVLYVWKS